MMIREQEHTMDSIAGTLGTLAQQASLMGQEINEHTEYVLLIDFLLRVFINSLGCSLIWSTMLIGQTTS